MLGDKKFSIEVSMSNQCNTAVKNIYNLLCLKLKLQSSNYSATNTSSFIIFKIYYFSSFINRKKKFTNHFLNAFLR